MELTSIYEAARKKEAVFDDPPTAAFQLEEGFGRVQSAMEKRTGAGAAFPRMLKPVDGENFRGFYRDLAAWLYGLK